MVRYCCARSGIRSRHWKNGCVSRPYWFCRSGLHFCGADGCHLQKREAVVSGEALGFLQHEGQFEIFLAAGVLSVGSFGLCGRA